MHSVVSVSRDVVFPVLLRMCNLQLFQERFWEKKVHATIPKGIVGGFAFTEFLQEIEKNGTRGHGRMFAGAKESS